MDNKELDRLQRHFDKEKKLRFLENIRLKCRITSTAPEKEARGKEKEDHKNQGYHQE